MHSLYFYLAALFGTALHVSAQDGPAITSITWTGSGCPAGSAASQIATTRKVGTVIFDSVQTELDPSAPATNQDSTNCSVSLSISSIPAGNQVVLQSLIWRGYMFLREGTTGSHTINATWSNNPSGAYSRSETENAGEHDLFITPNFSEADQSKYGSACTPIGGADASTVVTFGIDVTLQRNDPTLDALAQIDSLDFMVGLMAC